MTGRERVLTTLAGKRADRPPFFFRLDHNYKQTVADANSIEQEEITDFYGSDAEHIHIAYKPRHQNNENEHYDLYGNKIITVHYKGFTDSRVDVPVLANVEEASELTEIEFIDGESVDIPLCIERAKTARATGRAIYGGVWASIFTHPRTSMGEEKFLASMYDNPDLIYAVVEKFTDSFLKVNKAYMDACGEYIDIYHFGSDFATQNSLFISPGMFKEFFAPQMKRITSQAKSYGKPVMYHCCGAIMPLMDMFIECGVDIIDPVQVSSRNMTVEEVAAEYKGKIMFHGGVSSQVTFTKGTPEDIYKETQKAINILGPEGFIAAPDHDLLPNVPVPNLNAFVKAVKEYKY